MKNLLCATILLIPRLSVNGSIEISDLSVSKNVKLFFLE